MLTQIIITYLHNAFYNMGIELNYIDREITTFKRYDSKEFWYNRASLREPL